MKTTLRLKIDADPATLESLRKTRRAYAESFNRVVSVGWERMETNGVTLHHLTYYNERKLSPLGSALVVSARVKATESLRAAVTFRKKGRKAGKPVSLWSSVRYNDRCCTVDLGKGTASLSTVDGRKKVGLHVPAYHRPKLTGKICASELCERRDGVLFLHVCVELPAREFVDRNRYVGVDLGVKRPVVTSDNLFLGERRWRSVEARYFNLKRALQAKGTKSARRHLRRLSGKVNRFRSDCDHCLAKKVVQSAPAGTTFVLEDLTNFSRKKGGRKLRRRLHLWSYARFRKYLTYKAELAGCVVATVRPNDTSRICSGCGHCHAKNRAGSDFTCRKCGLRLNADLNAARNIRARHMVGLGMSRPVGLSSTSPSSPPGGKALTAG